MLDTGWDTVINKTDMALIIVHSEIIVDRLNIHSMYQGLHKCLMFEDLKLVEYELVGKYSTSVLVAFWLKKRACTV